MGACLAGICGGDTAPNVGKGGRAPAKPGARPRASMSGSIMTNSAGASPSLVYNIEKKEMGSGAFGTVMKATKKGNESIVVAMKNIEKSKLQDNIKAFVNEVEINRMMDHPNIVRLYETFEDKKHVYLAMECCRGGEMFDLIIEQGSFTEGDAAFLMNQILRALFYMHSKSVAHRDLKPENFLLQERDKPIKENALKVIDFGIAKIFTPGVPMKTKAGTLYYVAPEVMARDKGYNEKCDVWSAGVIMYILLCGAPPFSGSDADIVRAARSGKINFPREDFGHVADEVKDLIRSMCRIDVKTRLTAEQALQHSWVNNPNNKSKNASLGSQAFQKKIKDFGTVNRFKRTALQLIARRVDDKEIQKLKETFLRMDDNGDGKLTVEEMMNGCDQSGVMSQEDARKVFETIDADNSGSIDYSEFIAATLDKTSFLKKELCQEAFQVFDKDGNGTISLDELREMLHGVGGVANSESDETEINRMFKAADSDNSGEIDFNEFMEMLKKS